MPFSLPEIESWLSLAGPAAAGVLLISLWRHGLIRRYRFFALYLFLLLFELAVLMAVPRNTSRYFITYVVVESLMWVGQVLVILELFSLVVNRYPGIARSARNFIWIAFAAALLLSTAFAVFSPGALTDSPKVIQQYLLVARVISCTVLAFLFLLLAFLLYFPISLSRNVVSYAIGYGIYFASRAVTRLVGNLLDREYFYLLSVISLSVILACLIFWIVFLNRRGEEGNVSVGRQWSRSEAEAVTGQLNAINSILLKAGRK